ncbi:MAG: hypothetical protein JNJ54_21515 [Myxococcaceae bacterium]|nr:hypothetical protein [Myxococcaceae bacterium]
MLFSALTVMVLLAEPDPSRGEPAEPVPVEVAEPGRAAASVPPTKPATSPAQPTRDAAERLSGFVGFGSFGSAETSVAAPVVVGGVLLGNTKVTTPFLGVRWWTPVGGAVVRRLGLELAGGFSAGAASTEQALSGVVVVRDLATLRAVGLHVAIPFAVVSTPNFLGHVAPEVRHVGLDVLVPQALAPLDPSGMPGRTQGTATTDVSLRAAAEVFFGFAKVPNLSLELAVRVGLRATVSRGLDSVGALVLTSTQVFAVPFPSDLLNLFASSFALKYYL